MHENRVSQKSEKSCPGLHVGFILDAFLAPWTYFFLVESHPGEARGSQSGGLDKQGTKSCQLFRVGGEVVCQRYGNRRNQAGNQVGSEVQVYLNDKTYD